jgi:nucleoid-associated protein YgaU
MNQSNKIVAWLMAGAAAVGGAFGGAYYLNRDEKPPVEVAQPKQEAPASTTGEQVAAKPADEPAKAPETAVAPSDGMPRFDLLRVEKDGSTLVAGNAAPGSKVELLSAGQAIASADAGANGDFTIVLDQPLVAGAYELTLRATDPSGKTVTSEETGVVNLPKDGGELVAMVAKPGEATRVMQAGETQTAAVAPEQPAAETKTEEPVAPPVTSEKPAAVKPVLVSAVDYENGRIYVAGTGEPQRTVDIYIDDKLTGSTRVSADGSFLLEADMDLSVGEHSIRADMLSADGTSVEARAAVPLLHEPPAEVASAEQKPADGTQASNAAPTQETVSEAPAQQAPAAAAEAQPAAGGEQVAAAGSGAIPAPPPEAADIANTPPVLSPAPAAEAPSAEQPALAEQPAAEQPATSEQPAEQAASTEQPAEKAATTEQPAGQAASTEQPAEKAATTEQPAGQAATTEAAPATQQPIVTGASVIIRRGDNLWRISRRMLGKGIRYTTIYEANRDQIQDPSLIYPGQVFNVPGAEGEK